MSTAVLEQQQEAPVIFDAKAFIEARNKGEEHPMPGKPPEPKAKAEETPEPEVKPVPKHEEAPRLSRSVRREINQLREQLGAAKALAALAVQQKPAARDDDAEPARDSFASDAEYLRAAARWDRQQEQQQGTKDGEARQQTEAQHAHLKAMDEKAAKDIVELFPDWDEVSAHAAEDEDAPEFKFSEHKNLAGLLASSDVRAHVLYYWAKTPDALQRMLDMTETPNDQIRSFHRLEGRLEKEYSVKQAAQASDGETQKKDRKHLAEADRLGDTAADRDIRKPKPSTEVAAKGGTAPPDEPAIGSAAWMARRNQAHYGR